MTALLGTASLALGAAFVALGMIAVDELRRDTRSRGFSHFGVAFVLMAFTCGPHHLLDGYHVVTGEYPAQASVTMAVLFGVVPGWTFVWLRLEAMSGGRGERLIRGTPAWLAVTPVAFAVFTGAAIVIAADAEPSPAGRVTALPLASYALVACYLLVGWFLVRTQVRRHRDLGLWSLSGLALSAVFPTCALMHLTFALSNSGDSHMVVIDALSVPAALYFLYVVRRLYRQSLIDWNRHPLVGVPGEPARSSPWT